MQAISSKQTIQELGISRKPDPGKVLISNMPIIDQSFRVRKSSKSGDFGGLSYLPTENYRLPGLGPND